MIHVGRKFFITLIFTLCLLAAQPSIAQVYDGPVGNNSVPNTYQGFDQAPNTILEEPHLGAPGDGDPCFNQDPGNILCPIDDYVYVLLILGVGYGFIKFRKHKPAVV